MTTQGSKPPGTGHASQVSSMLDQLVGQYVDHTRHENEGTQLATSQGWIIAATSIQIGSRSLEDGTSDSWVSGLFVRDIAVGPTGRIDVVVSHEEDAATARMTIVAPWTITAPRGAGLVASPQGEIGIQEETGPRYAIPEALDVWTSSEPTYSEYQLLWSADDDWLTPGDVVAELVAAGVTWPQEIEDRGIDLLARLVVRGEVIEGWIGDTGFEPTDRPVAEVVEHIGTAWHAIGGKAPIAGDIGWYELTEAGKKRLENAPPPREDTEDD